MLRRGIVYGDLVYSYIFKIENHYKSTRTERVAVAFRGGLKEMWECHPTVDYIFQGSTRVVHGAVNAGVVGSNPTLGAT